MGGDEYHSGAFMLGANFGFYPQGAVPAFCLPESPKPLTRRIAPAYVDAERTFLEEDPVRSSQSLTGNHFALRSCPVRTEII